MSSERPYLVLTMRRTGGTSLTACMADVSRFRTAQHEPLNATRRWGAITRAFREDGNVDALNASLDAVLQSRPNVKHCYEIVPKRVTEGLVLACVRAGYAVFTLTRRDQVSRARSLALAQASGAWGPRKAAEIYPRILSGELQMPPVDLEAMRRRFARDRAKTRDLDAFLRDQGLDYTPVIFEELYHPDGHIADRVCALIARLNIAVTPDDPRLAAFGRSRGQGTDSIASLLPNAEAFEAALQAMRSEV